MANNNRVWTIWTGGIISTILITAITMIINATIANDKEARARDISIDEKREVLAKDVIRIDTNQKIVIDKLNKVSDKVDNLDKNQATMIVNQEVILKSLSRLENKIDNDR
jgi:hypothetical protein